MDNADEEMMRSNKMKKELDSALENASDSFASLCKDLTDQSKINGIRIIVNYTYGDELIVSKTFNSTGVAN